MHGSGAGRTDGARGEPEASRPYAWTVSIASV